MSAAPVSFSHYPTVTRQRLIRLTRRLPVDTDLSVAPGDRVSAEQPLGVANALALAVRVDLAERLGAAPRDAAKLLLHPVGTSIAKGGPLARMRRGLRTIAVPAPVTGTIVHLEAETGIVSIAPPSSDQPRAYVDGIVDAAPDRHTIDLLTVGSRIIGSIGLGRPTPGRLVLGTATPELPLDLDQIGDDLSGALVVAGGAVDAVSLSTLVARGAAGVISGSITIDGPAQLASDTGDDRLAIWRPGAGSRVIGDRFRLPLALLATEGIGILPMHPHLFALLAECAGQHAILFPETRLQAPRLQPQIIIPADVPHDPLTSDAAVDQAVDLTPGTVVRLTTQTDLGHFATVLREPRRHSTANHPQLRAVEVTLLQGGTRIVPISDLEVIG